MRQIIIEASDKCGPEYCKLASMHFSTIYYTCPYRKLTFSSGLKPVKACREATYEEIDWGEHV